MKIQQSQLNASIRDIPLPDSMRELPVSKQGYPVPFFVARGTAPDWDFRVVHPTTVIQCLREHLCWICGQPMGPKKVFVVGPMCVVTRTSAEPPSHLSCSEYAAIACPFLTQPRMKRNEVNLPEGYSEPAGLALKRNPGVVAVLVTRSFKRFNDGKGGMLIEMGQPEQVKWYAQRRPATRKQVMDSIESGMPLLIDQCNAETTPNNRDQARRELREYVSAAMRWVPEGEGVANVN